MSARRFDASKRSGSIKTFVASVIAIALFGAAGYAWWRTSGHTMYESSEDAPMLHEVAAGPFDHIVLEQGEIESSSNNEVKCEVKGRGTSGTPILNVLAEGTFVKKGDKLCQLDSSALDQEAQNQRIAVS
ncbi:MAG: hypothetical protein ABL921_16360, partial [Pirellula sp.]